MTTNTEALQNALHQASFCIRELLPGNKDAELTLGVINAALASAPAQPVAMADEQWAATILGQLPVPPTDGKGLNDWANLAVRTVRAALSAQAAPKVPEGWQLIKVSRLEEILRLADDPSEPCYEGRGLYDERQVHKNWTRCTQRLEEIKYEVQCVIDPHSPDAYELREIMHTAAPLSATSEQRKPLTEEAFQAEFNRLKHERYSDRGIAWGIKEWTERSHGIRSTGGEHE